MGSVATMIPKLDLGLDVGVVNTTLHVGDKPYTILPRQGDLDVGKLLPTLPDLPNGMGSQLTAGLNEIVSKLRMVTSISVQFVVYGLLGLAFVPTVAWICLAVQAYVPPRRQLGKAAWFVLVPMVLDGLYIFLFLFLHQVIAPVPDLGRKLLTVHEGRAVSTSRHALVASVVHFGISGVLCFVFAWSRIASMARSAKLKVLHSESAALKFFAHLLWHNDAMREQGNKFPDAVEPNQAEQNLSSSLDLRQLAPAVPEPAAHSPAGPVSPVAHPTVRELADPPQEEVNLAGAWNLRRPSRALIP